MPQWLKFFACGGQKWGLRPKGGNHQIFLKKKIFTKEKFIILAPLIFPKTTMLGALINFISEEQSSGSSKSKNNFQPMPPNFGLLPDLNKRIRDKRCRYGAYRDRALEEIKTIQIP